MKSLFPVFGLILAASLAFGAGCAEDGDLFGVGGGKKGSSDPKATPTPTATPSGTGGSIIND
ncbi:hypothetical protein D3C72_417570 [compost metagenome]